jgi:hypothetical protein
VQWLDGNQNPISGANSASFVAPVPGTYYVRLRAGTSCVATSGGSIVLGTSERALRGVTLQPNPTRDRVEISWNAQGAQAWTAELRSMDGALIGTYEGADARWTLDLSSLPQGVYALRLFQGDRTRTEQLVKL